MICFYCKKHMCHLSSSWTKSHALGLVNVFGPLGEANLLVLLYLSLPDSRVKFLDFFSILTVEFLVLLGPLSFNVVNIYAPNTVSERKTFFERLHDYFISNGLRIIAGDFNCIDNVLDRLRSSNTSLPDKRCLTAFYLIFL